MFKVHRQRSLSRWLVRAVLFSGTLWLVSGTFFFESTLFRNSVWISPASAQSLRPEGAAYIIYQRLTYLPKENQYRRQDTGAVDPEHTLISRIIRYHEDVKRRSPEYRFDWQLTIADYLGVNEPIFPERYPGQNTLQTNPADNDMAAIRKLNRRQRQELIDLLAELYAPPPPQDPTPNAPKPKPKPSQSPSTTPARPQLTKPGDANLLKF